MEENVSVLLGDGCEDKSIALVRLSALRQKSRECDTPRDRASRIEGRDEPRGTARRPTWVARPKPKHATLRACRCEPVSPWRAARSTKGKARRRVTFSAGSAPNAAVARAGLSPRPSELGCGSPGRRLPDHVCAVRRKLRVARDDRVLVQQRLGDDEAVEWIAMERRQPGDTRHGIQVDFKLLREQVSGCLRK